MRKKREMNKFGIMITLLAVMVSMAGVAAASPFNLNIVGPNPTQFTPGQTNNFGVSVSNLLKVPHPLPHQIDLTFGAVDCNAANPPPYNTVCDNALFKLVGGLPTTVTASTDPQTFNNVFQIKLDGTPTDPDGTQYTLHIKGVDVTSGEVIQDASISLQFTTPKRPPPNRSEFWELEWFHTKPDQYTEFLLQGGQKYLITSGFVAPEARTIIWDDAPAPIAVKKGDRLKYWYDPEIGGGDLYVHSDGVEVGDQQTVPSSHSVRLYGTFDEGPGDLKAIDPATGLRPENPPYTDPISPFFPQANQSPRKDFITFNPALMDHNGDPAYTQLLYYNNPEHSQEGLQSPKEKVFKRMWYEKEWFKDDYQSKANGRWDVVIETQSGAYVTTLPLDDEQAIHAQLKLGNRIREQNNDPTLGDTYAPAVKQEFAYMALDDVMMPVLIQTGSKIMVPIANAGGYGLNSFESVPGKGNDAVRIESEQTLGLDINNDGTKKPLDTDGKEVSGDESVVLVLGNKVLNKGDSLQFFDNVVTLKNVFNAPNSIGYDVCDNEGGGSTNCATGQVLQVGQVAKYQRGTQDNSGPFYIKLVAVNTNTGEATIEVGRLFGNTLANIGKNPRWNEKAFIVKDVFYNVVGIKAKDNKFKYIVFREKLPKFPIKLYGKHLHVWNPGEPLPEMPPFNMPHEIFIDVQNTQTKPVDQGDKIGPRSSAGPLVIYYTVEDKEARFRGELKEIYAESSNPFKEFWELEWFNTKPEQFTQFVLPRGQLYLVTTGFWAPEASTHIWDGNATGEEKPIAVKHGDRLKFWHDPAIGSGLFINNSNGAVRLYGTFDEGPGDLNATDPANGFRPENPPYTDPISPFFPQSPQSPRKDFVTFNPAIMDHNGDPKLDEPAYPQLNYYLNPEHSQEGLQSPKEKVFKRMWYEKEWFKDDYQSKANGRWDVVIETQSGAYVTTLPLDDEQAIHAQIAAGNRIREQNNNPTLGDTYAPAVKQEFAYMTLNDITMPVLVQNGSSILIPMAHDPKNPYRGLNSFDSTLTGNVDAVRVESEQTLGLDINNDGTTKPMDTDGKEVSGDESVVLVLGNKVLKVGDSIQFFDNNVTLRGATNAPDAINYDVCDNEGGGSTNCKLNENLQPGQVAKYSRGKLENNGPFYIKLIAVNTNQGVEEATIEVGRLFGNTLANIGANPRWNEKAFMVDEVFYNVVGIKAEDNKFKYIVFRQKLPKDDIKLYGKDLKVWSPGEILPEMPPFNLWHAALEDVQDTWTKPLNQQDKIGPKFMLEPLQIRYTIELKEPRFKGELKEIYAENETQTPTQPPTGTCILPNGKNVDLNGDGTVDIGDATVLINNWDASGGPADLNGDGTVDIGDATVLINNWDKKCT